MGYGGIEKYYGNSARLAVDGQTNAGDEKMRQYAYLKEPYTYGDGVRIFKIMLYRDEKGVSLFEYDDANAVQCCADRWYPSAEEAHEDWDSLIDERGWLALEDPLPDCQHDAFIPLRVRGRSEGKPEWGKFETLLDGRWVEYRKEER